MHDNTTAQAFAADFISARELCESHSAADDILSGVLAAKTSGNSATRALSRGTLFHIITSCTVISTESIDAATGGRYAPSTLQAYAAAARVASRAFAGLALRMASGGHRPTAQDERHRVDAPYLPELRARGLI